MCGPLACSLMPVRTAPTENKAQVDAHTVSTVYHISRLSGYAILGAIGGALGKAPLSWISQSALRWMPWALVLFFLALAFRWDRFLPKLTMFGHMARSIQCRLRNHSRVNLAAAMGLATPLLPCGPLYFIVTLALLSGSALRGVEFMLAFGLGTVPLLWFAQTQFQWVRQKLSPLWLNRTRVILALFAAGTAAWRLRATVGISGPDPTHFLCH